MLVKAVTCCLILTVAMLLGFIAEPKINLVFSSWLSFFLIVGLLLGFIVWISYVAISISSIKLRMTGMMTRKEFQDQFEKFKKEIRGDE